MYVFIDIFYSFWLKWNMIQQGLCLEDGQGFLISQSLSQKKASGLPLSSIRAFVSLWSQTFINITDLCHLSPGKNNKMVIVKPASSVVFSMDLQKWL